MQGGGPNFLILMALIFGVFYFMMIRPQVKRQKAHQAMLDALKKGERVITRGGLVGKITGLADDTLTLELQEKVRVRVLRTHIEGKYEPKKSDSTESKAAKAA